MNRLPEKFEESISKKLGDQFPAFASSLLEPAPVSIRINPLKNNHFKAQEFVPWSQYGRYLPLRPVFTLDPLFHGGSYYVQEASSMFLEQAFKQSVNLQKPQKVLDLCAAPGGKSTHLLSLLHPESLLVSNEVIRSRASILSENIQKWGYPNAVVTNNDPKDFAFLEGFFDVILVDAPCSGEGLFRKDPEAMEEWSPDNVQHCSIRQKRIVADIWNALREDGIFIYCTCTYNQKENDEILKWMHDNYHPEFLKLETDPSWGITEVNTDSIFAYRFFPHQVKGEGFFISVMRKTETTSAIRLKSKKKLPAPVKKIQERLNGWISTSMPVTFFQFNDLVFFAPACYAGETEFLLQHLKILYAGTNLASVRHDKLIPEHSLAMSVQLKNPFPTADVKDQEAIQYLRKDTLHINDMAIGYCLLTFKDLPLGWVNVLSGRVNNMYPSDWRIRMDYRIMGK